MAEIPQYQLASSYYLALQSVLTLQTIKSSNRGTHPATALSHEQRMRAFTTITSMSRNTTVDFPSDHLYSLESMYVSPMHPLTSAFLLRACTYHTPSYLVSSTLALVLFLPLPDDDIQ